MPPIDFKRLEDRVGRIHLAQRLGIQADHASDYFGQGFKYLNIENVEWLPILLKLALRCTFLFRRGQRNAQDIRVTHHDVPISRLPEPFDGYTILQLSDLHLDINPAICDAIIERLKDVTYDVCVLTGDYRFRTHGPIEACMALMARLRRQLRDPVYGILGNHDFIEMLADFEAMAVPILLNESAEIQRDGASLYLTGVDDPHFYLAHNIEKALQGVPPDAVTILLSHSPELYEQAAYAGFDLMLSGHTHGGQVCLPGGFAPYLNAQCPRAICAGSWKHKQMIGYTSRGAGSSGLDVRFNCPPEMTLHRLRCGW